MGRRKSTEPMATVMFRCPERIKEAGMREAERRGIDFSDLMKNYLASFLPESPETMRDDSRGNI